MHCSDISVMSQRCVSVTSQLQLHCSYVIVMCCCDVTVTHCDVTWTCNVTAILVMFHCYKCFNTQNYSNFRFYESNPDSELGFPGKFQGLNVGVLLLKLDKMRNNWSYNQYLTSNGTRVLARTYGFTGTSLGLYQFLSASAKS